MLPQSPWVFKGLATLVTDERLAVCVGCEMPRQVTLCKETRTTYFTREFLLLCSLRGMFKLLVQSQVVSLRAGKAAVFTHERLLPRMCPTVYDKPRPLTENLITVVHPAGEPLVVGQILVLVPQLVGGKPLGTGTA